VSRIATTGALDELHDALRDAHVLGSDPRFMHVEMDIPLL
jgi:hypothetical protein